MRLQRIVRDDAGQIEAEAFVETRSTVIDGGVEHKQGTAALDCQFLRLGHQRGRDATMAMTDFGHHLCDLGDADRATEAYAKGLQAAGGKPSNAAELMAVANVNGALVGGASLKASDFLGIAAGF